MVKLINTHPSPPPTHNLDLKTLSITLVEVLLLLSFYAAEVILGVVSLHSNIVYQQGSMAIYYGNDPKFSERQFWANSADPDQTAPRGAV